MKHQIARTEVKQVFGRNMRSSKSNRFTGAAKMPATAHMTHKVDTHQRAAKVLARKNMQAKLMITAKSETKALEQVARTVTRIAQA